MLPSDGLQLNPQLVLNLSGGFTCVRQICREFGHLRAKVGELDFLALGNLAATGLLGNFSFKEGSQLVELRFKPNLGTRVTFLVFALRIELSGESVDFCLQLSNFPE